jgi:hypothetical protein
LAHEQSANPVKISLSGDIPEAGSAEAEKILGGTGQRGDPELQSEEKTSSKKKDGGRFGKKDQEKEKGTVQHSEDVGRMA